MAINVEPPLQDFRDPVFRIVSSRFPPVGIYERFGLSGEEMELLFEIENLTNPRIRQEVGDLSLVPVADRISGPGASPIMAAFTHIGHPSRFSAGEYGVYYAAESLETAVAETIFHREQFLRATREPSVRLEMRVYESAVLQPLHDLRGLDYAPLHQPDDYGPSQIFAAELRKTGAWGVLYRSVRRAGGICVGILRPPALKPAVQRQHLAYFWDGGEQEVVGWKIISEG